MASLTPVSTLPKSVLAGLRFSSLQFQTQIFSIPGPTLVPAVAHLVSIRSNLTLISLSQSDPTLCL